MFQMKGLSLLSTLGVAVLLCSGSPAAAQTAPPLGTTANFAVLGGSTVTNTGSSIVTGDLGLWPGLSITGFPPGTVIGTTHTGDAVAMQAQSDLVTAYNDLAGQACDTNLTGQDLGGLTLPPAVYCFSTSAQLTGTLTLDAQGNSAAVFVFQIGSTLTTASNAVVQVINGGSNCNIFWQVGSSATLGTTTTFAGNILALTSITANSGSNISGRVLARNGAVTLDTNAVALCASTCPPMTILPVTLPNPVVGASYSQPITASGSTPDTYVYTVTAGVPPGLLLDAATPVKTVNLAGIPTTPGVYSFAITATDANGCQISQPYLMVVAPAGCPTVTVLPAALPAPVIGVPYTQTISATGGISPYIYIVSAGALPPGLLLTPQTATPTASLSGTTTATGSFSFTITATDANGCPGTRDYTLFVERATGVPTVSTWGLLILIALTGLVSTWYLRKAA